MRTSRCFAEVLQEPARARASSALYRSFVLTEARAGVPGRATARAGCTVPTRLLSGADDPVIRPALLAGWRGTSPTT